MIQKVAKYYSLVDGSNELLATGFLELSSTCHTRVEVLVSEVIHITSINNSRSM